MHRVVHAHFEKFAQARLAFVRAVADCAERPDCIEPLLADDVFYVLRPLLHDKVPTVQATAALAVGRVASASAELAFEVVKAGLLDDITRTVGGSHPSHMKAAAFVFRNIAKHTPELTQCCIDAGCITTLVACLEQLDVTVREAAASALAVLASHTEPQAQAVAASGCLPLLVAALQEPEPALKRAASCALGEIANPAESLARAVAEAGAVPLLIQHLKHAEVKVRRQAGMSLVSVVRHSAALAGVALTHRVFPTALLCLQDADGVVRKFAACVVRDIVKQSEDCAVAAVSAGAVPSLVAYMTTKARGADRLPGTMAVGFIASYAAVLAAGIVDAGGVGALKDALLEDAEDHLKAAAVWAIGQVGKHAPPQARAIAEADVLRYVLTHHLVETGSEDLRDKCKRCLKAVLPQCDHIMALQSLIATAPADLLQIVLHRIGEVIKTNLEERRNFLASGGLKLVQAVDVSTDMDVASGVEAINACYPPEVVEYVKPTFMAGLAERMG